MDLLRYWFLGLLAFAAVAGCGKALRLYLVKHPVIAAKREGRAKALDLPPVIFSQDEILIGGH